MSWTLLLRFLPHILVGLAVAFVIWKVTAHLDEFERRGMAEEKWKAEAQLHYDVLTQERAAHNRTKMSYQKYIRDMSQNVKEMAANLNEVNSLYRKSEESRNALTKIFTEHEFTRLAEAKPGLISSRATLATKRLFDDLEKLTGAGSPEGDARGSSEDSLGVPPSFAPELKRGTLERSGQ